MRLDLQQCCWAVHACLSVTSLLLQGCRGLCQGLTLRSMSLRRGLIVSFCLSTAGFKVSQRNLVIGKVFGTDVQVFLGSGCLNLCLCFHRCDLLELLLRSFNLILQRLLKELEAVLCGDFFAEQGGQLLLCLHLHVLKRADNATTLGGVGRDCWSLILDEGEKRLLLRMREGGSVYNGTKCLQQTMVLVWHLLQKSRTSKLFIQGLDGLAKHVNRILQLGLSLLSLCALGATDLKGGLQVCLILGNGGLEFHHALGSTLGI
mmetsp:Transcript_32317/g.58653  ORF Transcript_32317/g.58653 Transcript_32317/m.58653 type:complete len:261 (+) Transcript_32317:1069-1851(+)